LFGDDCFLFFRTEEREAQVMKNILATYELAYGQTISLLKIKVYYSSSVHTHLKDAITTIVGVRAVMGTGKYLSLLFMVGRIEDAVFGFIKDQILHKINT
jgi:hypothetical protein